MVETRRSSSSSKRPLDSPLPASKRPKESEASSSTEDKLNSGHNHPGEAVVANHELGSESREPPEVEVRSADPPPNGSPKPSDLTFPDKPPSVPTKGDAVVVEEKEAKPAVKRHRKQNSPAWAQLISQSSQNPNMFLFNSLFTIGTARQCNLSLRDDHSVSKILCRLQRTEQGGSSIIKLEISGNKGAVQLNGKIHQKGSSPLTITGGDELIFGTTGRYSYIFQQLSKDTVSAPGLTPSVPILEAQSAPAKNRDVNARGRDTSAVAGASILASLSNISKGLQHLPPSRGNDEDSVPGSLSGASDNGFCDVEMNESMELEGDSLNQNEVDAGSDENMNVDDGKDNGMDNEEVRAPGSNKELRPLLQLLARSSNPDPDFRDRKSVV